jgi:hypothetical protein
MPDICTSHLIVPELTIQILFGEEFKLRSFSLCIFPSTTCYFLPLQLSDVSMLLLGNTNGSVSRISMLNVTSKQINWYYKLNRWLYWNKISILNHILSLIFFFASCDRDSLRVVDRNCPLFNVYVTNHVISALHWYIFLPLHPPYSSGLISYRIDRHQKVKLKCDGWGLSLINSNTWSGD